MRRKSFLLTLLCMLFGMTAWADYNPNNLPLKQMTSANDLKNGKLYVFKSNRNTNRFLSHDTDAANIWSAEGHETKNFVWTLVVEDENATTKKYALKSLSNKYVTSNFVEGSTSNLSTSDEAVYFELATVTAENSENVVGFSIKDGNNNYIQAGGLDLSEWNTSTTTANPADYGTDWTHACWTLYEVNTTYETSTHDTPKYYTFKAYRSANGGDGKGYYLSYNGDNGTLQRTALPTSLSYWYFVADGEGGGVKMYNRAAGNTKALASKSSFTADGITWYLIQHNVHPVCLAISTKAEPANESVCLDASNGSNGLSDGWNYNDHGTAWYINPATPNETQLAMVPEFTTDLNNPVYYRIKSLRSGKYAAFNGTSSQLKQVAAKESASLWYFTPASSNFNPETGVKIHNAATGEVLASNASFTKTGSTWYLIPNLYNENGYSISLKRDLTANCWDDASGKIGYWNPRSNDNVGTTWIFEHVDVSSMKVYVPGERVSTLENGKKYFIINTSTDSGARWGWYHNGNASNLQLNKTALSDMGPVSDSYLWEVTTTSTANKYYLKSVSTSTYVGPGGATNNSATKDLYIQEFSTSPRKATGGYGKDLDMNDVAVDDITPEHKLFTVSGTPEASTTSDCWNGVNNNPPTFTTWKNGHPIAFYTVEEVSMEDYILMGAAEEAIAKTGVGYPTANDEARTALRVAIDADPTGSDYGTELSSALETYKNSKNIQYPENGKAYKIYAQYASKTPQPLYFNGTRVTAKNEENIADENSMIFVCRNFGEARFALVNNAGKYLIWCDDQNAVKSVSVNGCTDVYEEKNKWEINTPNIRGDGWYQFGKLYMRATCKDNTTRYFSPRWEGENTDCAFVSADTDGWFLDEAGGNGGKERTPLFSFEEVTSYPTTVNVSAEIAEVGSVATYSAKYPIALPTGVTAYYATDNFEADGVTTVEMTPLAGEAIPANTGVVLVSESAQTVSMLPATTEAIASLEEGKEINYLGNSAGATKDLSTETGNVYILANGDNGVGFYALNAEAGATIAMNKSYLVLPTAGAVKMKFGGNVTGIESIDNGELTIDNDAPVYDLSGRKVANPVKGGIYVKNGKKIIF